ncbi:hypothetical protein BH23VER1_BH23VER1_14350 [soil metagenome]
MLVAGLGAGTGLAQDGASFEITSVRLASGGETVELKFGSELGKTYRVEGSPALGAGEGSWSDMGVSGAGSGDEMTLSVATAGLGGRYFLRIATDAFVLIPAGTFQMGDAFDEGTPDERPVHAVNVSAFFLQSTETTKAEWDAVRAWALENGYSFSNPGFGKGTDHPVHTVSWYDAVKWCNARSEMEGLAPCYHTDGLHNNVYRTGLVDLTNRMVKWNASGYRLPTEAEWEKAARGGLQGRRFPWGDTITHSLANYLSDERYPYDTSPTRGFHPDYDEGPSPDTSPVGSFAPNGYGLFDMAGNVDEWCWDWYDGSYYGSPPEADPLGPASGSLGSYRILRGGPWNWSAVVSRVTSRGKGNPLYWANFLGFRPARGQ